MASLSAVPSAADGARSPGGAELQGSAEQLKALDIYKQPDTSKGGWMDLPNRRSSGSSPLAVL